jgi:hypothetical protein
LNPTISQGSRLFSPRAFSIGVAPWRVLSGGKNQSFAMPVSITNFGRFGNLKFFKKPLAWKRTFDILCAPFRLKSRTPAALESGSVHTGERTAVADR